MVAPIPKGLLIHEITYEDFKSGRHGDEYLEPQEVKYVRLDAKTKRIKTADGQDIISQTTLFWDAVNSDYCRFHKNGRVTFNGTQMHVKEVGLFHDESKLHHLEVSLE
ncbi:MAG: putative minor capsid protein [Tetragenococcus koreensis]|nr:putative minor capsid protein [Tetragenococcus koreensis]